MDQMVVGARDDFAARGVDITDPVQRRAVMTAIDCVTVCAAKMGAGSLLLACIVGVGIAVEEA